MSRWGKRLARGEVLLVAAIAVAATGALALIPGLRFAYRSPNLHVALLTAEALIGLLAAYLAFERFRRRPALDSLALCLALVLLALPNLLFAAVPVVVASDTTVFSTWSALLGRLTGAIAFAFAAFAPAARLRRLSRARTGVLIAAPLLFLGLIALGVAALEGELPRALPPGSAPELSGSVRIEGHWSIQSLQLVGLVAFAAAAVGFARGAERDADELLRWLAAAAVLGAAARLNYFLYPSTFTEWVYTGDFFRLLFYVVILVAALREIDAYSRGVGRAAALEERARIARDLHDGLAQELAAIVRNLRGVDTEDRFIGRARASAERALAQARRAIAALTEQSDVRIDVALAETARAVAEREGTRVVLELARDVELDPAEREALVMITSEAVTNAARHGGAGFVRVELTPGRRVRLRIGDDGRGFDPDLPRPGSYGLEGMRARAAEIGASLSVDSRPGQGTEILVIL